MKPIELYYLEQPEPERSCLLALRNIILSVGPDIKEEWKYKLPFFCYKGKMFCYFWKHKKLKQPYIGIIEGHRFDYPFLLKEKRSRIKIMLINPNEDLPIHQIELIIIEAIGLYKSGIVKIKA